MKFKVVNQAFKEKMKILSDFSFNDEMGSYVNVKTGDNDTVIISRENNINACEVTVFANIEYEGEITLPFSELFNVVISSDTKELTFETSENFLHLFTDDENQNFEYKIRLIHMQVEPLKWETNQEFSFNAFSFTRQLKKAINFASINLARAYICGVNVENIDGTLRMSATDGKRAFRTIPMLNGSKQKQVAPFRTFTMPTKFAKIIVKDLSTMEEDILFKVGNNCLSVVGNKINMHTTLIREKFVNLDKVMEYTPNLSLTCEVRPLLKAVIRASACIDKNNGVFLEIETNAVTVSAESETKTVTDTIDAYFTGEKTTLSFNFDYLKSLLENFSADSINIGLGTSTTPIMANDKNAFYMLMPMAQSQ